MYDIGLPELKVYNRMIRWDDTFDGEVIVYYAVAKCVTQKCIYCGGKITKPQYSDPKYLRDIDENGYPVKIHFRNLIFKCSDCHRTFTQHLTSVDPMAIRTNRFCERILSNCYSRSFQQLEKDTNIGRPVLREVFLNFTKKNKDKIQLYSPKCLIIKRVFFNNDVYTVFVDALTNTILEVLPGENPQMIQDTITSMPDNQNIECVIIEMQTSYRDNIRQVLPKVEIVLDIHNVNKTLYEMMVNIFSCQHGSIHYPRRKINIQINSKRAVDLLSKPAEELNYYETIFINLIMDKYPHLRCLYNLKESFYDILIFSETQQEAELAYIEWIKRVKAENCTEFNAFIQRIEFWHKEIFRYFKYSYYINNNTKILDDIMLTFGGRGRSYQADFFRLMLLYRNFIFKTIGEQLPMNVERKNTWK